MIASSRKMLTALAASLLPLASSFAVSETIQPTRPSVDVNLLSSWTLASDGDVGLDGAFQDSVNLFDEKIQLMSIAFFVVVGALLALKTLSSQMDIAISQVLVDFEATMKSEHPKKWQDIEARLGSLQGDDRQAEILKAMGELQEKQPEFMEQVREKMNTT